MAMSSLATLRFLGLVAASAVNVKERFITISKIMNQSILFRTTYILMQSYMLVVCEMSASDYQLN